MNIFKKIKSGATISNSEFATCNEEPIEIFRAYEEKIRGLEKENQSVVNQYNKVVEQNKSLQKQIKAPFFPYPLNDGGRADFGEFYLISHAWFTFLNTPLQIGIIEVEYKTLDKKRVMYIGIAHNNEFSIDVLNIAQYGQKIKESV